MLSLEEARDVFLSLISGKPEKDYFCYTYLTTCHMSLGDYEKAFDTLRAAFDIALKRLADMEDGYARKLSEATLSVAFYYTLWRDIPESEPKKAGLMSARAGALPTLWEAREMFSALLDGNPDQAWVCRYNIGICLALEGDREGACGELEEAERLHPEDGEIRAMLELARALPPK